MAGTILISKSSSVATSSIDFNHIVEETRKKLDESEKIVVQEIYRPYDHEGMSFITLWNAPAEAFNTFYRATLKAKADALSKFPARPQNNWNELCEKLKSDPRWIGEKIQEL